MRRQWFRAGVLALALTLGCAWKGYVERGDALLAVHDYDAAASQYEKALQLRPGDTVHIQSKDEGAIQGIAQVHLNRCPLARTDPSSGQFNL